MVPVLKLIYWQWVSTINVIEFHLQTWEDQMISATNALSWEALITWNFNGFYLFQIIAAERLGTTSLKFISSLLQLSWNTYPFWAGVKIIKKNKTSHVPVYRSTFMIADSWIDLKLRQVPSHHLNCILQGWYLCQKIFANTTVFKVTDINA